MKRQNPIFGRMIVGTNTKLIVSILLMNVNNHEINCVINLFYVELNANTYSFPEAMTE